jgi:hypothetical protein
MTTSNDVTNYTWTGVIASAATQVLPFELDDDDDILVTSVIVATGVETLPVKAVDYSVTTGATPVLTSITGIASGSAWVIDRQQQPIQDVDYQTGTKLPAASFETGLDKVTHMVADLWTQMKRVVKSPDGETPAEGDFTMPTVDVRKSNFLFWDALGDITPVAGITTLAPTVPTALGTSLVETASAAGMRTLLEVDKEAPFATQGDMKTEGAAGPVVIAAPNRPGLVLHASALHLSEDSGSVDLEPQWLRPWPDQFCDVTGFNIQVDAGTTNTVVAIGQGYCHPKFRWGSSGTQNSAGSQGKLLRYDNTTTGQFTKDITAAWASGTGNGCLPDGYSHTAYDILYLFVIGRTEDTDVEFCLGENIEGTDVEATAAIATWADTAGGNKLFIRRIRTIPTGSSLTMPYMHTNGDRTIFETYWIGLAGTTTLTVADATIYSPGPTEFHETWGRYNCTGGASGSVYYLGNSLSATGPEKMIDVAHASVEVGGQFHVEVGTDRAIEVSVSTGTDAGTYYFKGFTDARGRTL